MSQAYLINTIEHKAMHYKWKPFDLLDIGKFRKMYRQIFMDTTSIYSVNNLIGRQFRDHCFNEFPTHFYFEEKRDSNYVIG